MSKNYDKENIKWQLRSGQIKQDLKVAFLTFDDGPDEGTEEVLDILKDLDVKATFFTFGKRPEKSKRLFKRIRDEGHHIGNHSVSHQYKGYSDPKSLLKEIKEQQNNIREMIEEEPLKLFRFPGGSDKNSTEIIEAVKDAGYTYFDWDASAGDGASGPLPTEETTQKILNEVGEKQTPIILFHAEAPRNELSRQAIRPVVEQLKDQGYVFMFLDPDYKLRKK